MVNGIRKNHTQVPRHLDNLSSKQSKTMLFLRNKDVVVPNKSCPGIIKKKKNDAPQPEMQVKPAEKGFFSNAVGAIQPFVAKITAYGVVLVSLLTFGWIGTSTTQAQTQGNARTEQSGKQSKLTWGDVKAKYSTETAKAAEKTWVEKITPGAKKYDVEYNNGVLTFVNWEGTGKDLVCSLNESELLELRQLANAPLRVIWHTLSKNVKGVCLVFDDKMVFFAPERSENGVARVSIEILGQPNKRLSANIGSR